MGGGSTGRGDILCIWYVDEFNSICIFVQIQNADNSLEIEWVVKYNINRTTTISFTRLISPGHIYVTYILLILL